MSAPFGLTPHRYDERCLCPRCIVGDVGLSSPPLPREEWIFDGRLWSMYRPMVFTNSPSWDFKPDLDVETGYWKLWFAYRNSSIAVDPDTQLRGILPLT